MRTITLFACAAALVPQPFAPPTPPKPSTPVRLPAYEQPNLVTQTEVCAEHGEPVTTKTVLQGANKGKEYFCCSNAIPCGHFRWVPKPLTTTGRLAGDGAQVNRQPVRNVASKRPSDVAEAWLNGTLTRIVFRGDTGFTIARILPDGASTPFVEELYSKPESKQLKTLGIKADACLVSSRVGDHVLLKGWWGSHPRFGRQFNADALLEERACQMPRSRAMAFGAWLASGAVPGVGVKTAQKVVDALGDEAEALLSRYGDSQGNDLKAEAALSSALGWDAAKTSIGKAATIRLATGVARDAANRGAILACLELGLPVDAAAALERQHGPQAAGTFKKDPYRALTECKGWGFLRTDAVACPGHAAPDDAGRLRHGVAHALAENAARGGHCCLPVSELLAALEKSSGPLHVPGSFTPTRGHALSAIDQCLAKGSIRGLRIGDDDLEDLFLFSPWLDAAERSISTAVEQRIPPEGARQAELAASQDDQLPGEHRLSEEQRTIVALAAKQPLSILAGGPGTGKTFAAKFVVERWRSEGLENVALAAPTARGAAALGAAIGAKASTLHRLLEWQPQEGGFARNDRNPLDCDAVIIDELSMLEAPLAAKLFSALPAHCKVLLVGDPDQLPPVGPGAVLRDLLSCRETVPRITLKRIFRTGTLLEPSEDDPAQNDASDVARDAKAINAGIVPKLSRSTLRRDGSIPDGVVLLEEDPDNGAKVRDRVVEVVKELGEFYDPLGDVQVLAPMKRGATGTRALNAALQDLLNPSNTKEEDPETRKVIARKGDRVMQLSNDYETGVFNGDVGLVDTVMRNGSFVSKFQTGAKTTRVMYSLKDVGDTVSLAYALTVHKAQGAEYPVVILPLVKDHFPMLRRALLYTAVSRAKRLLVLVGSSDLLADAVKRPLEQKRRTAIATRILNERADGELALPAHIVQEYKRMLRTLAPAPFAVPDYTAALLPAPSVAPAHVEPPATLSAPAAAPAAAVVVEPPAADDAAPAPPGNAQLVDVFTQLAKFAFQHKDKQRGYANQKVALALEHHGAVIASGAEAMALPGVGKSSADKIDEFLASGKVAQLEEYWRAELSPQTLAATDATVVSR